MHNRMPVAAVSLHVIAAMIHGIAGDTQRRLPKLGLSMRQQLQGQAEAHQALPQEQQLSGLLYLSNWQLIITYSPVLTLA
jgi:hypothetical protein